MKVGPVIGAEPGHGLAARRENRLESALRCSSPAERSPMNRRIRPAACWLSLALGACLLGAGAPPAAGDKSPSEGWKTPAEAANYQTTPRYDETMAYLRKLAAAAPKQLKLEAFGSTGEG